MTCRSVARAPLKWSASVEVSLVVVAVADIVVVVEPQT